MQQHNMILSIFPLTTYLPYNNVIINFYMKQRRANTLIINVSCNGSIYIINKYEITE